MNAVAGGRDSATGWRVLLAVLGLGVLVFSVAMIFLGTSTSIVTEATPMAGQSGLIDSKRTTTTSPVSAELSTSVLGFTLILLLVAAYYDRITKLTGLGITAELSSADQQTAAQVVGEKAKDADPEITRLAVGDVGAEPAEAAAAATHLAVKSASATVVVQDSAKQLLALSQVNPEQCRKLAATMGVPESVVQSSVLLKRTTRELWEALADHALARI